MRSDAELVKAYRAGDRDSLEALLRRYQPSLFSFLRRKLGTTPLAEDALQETYVNVMKHISGYKEAGHFKAWIFTIAYREALATYKKRKNHVPIDNADDFQDFLLEDPEQRPDAVYSRKEKALLLEKALASLNIEERDVVLLRLKEDLRFKDIADITKTPLNTVLSRMRTAMQKLKTSQALRGIDDAM